MKGCSCPATWYHAWCPFEDDDLFFWCPPVAEETFEEERRREVGERFAYDTDTDTDE